MNLLMDGLLLAAALFAGAYCWILSRRISGLQSLDRGLGGSIVSLTRQVELARSTLEEAQQSVTSNSDMLRELLDEADKAAELLNRTITEAKTVETASPPARVPRAPSGKRQAMQKLATEPIVAALMKTTEPSEQTKPAPEKEAAPGPQPEAEYQPAGETAPDPLPAPAASGPDEPSVPKPASLPAMRMPLRNAPLLGAAQSDEDILDALAALAAGRPEG